MAERDSAKQAEAAATGEEKEHYRRVQEAIKILMNSVYGVFASYFYRFTNLDIGASITAYAREAVRDIISELESEGLAVIYGDTDSVFFGSPHDNKDETVAFGEAIAARYSGGARQLEFEKILHPFFSHGAKKRYVGQQVWARGTIRAGDRGRCASRRTVCVARTARRLRTAGTTFRPRYAAAP